jgi:hypothetical protein
MPRACAYHCGPTVMLASQIICMTPSIVYDLRFRRDLVLFCSCSVHVSVVVRRRRECTYIKVMAPPKIRTYIDDYVKFGFTFIEKDGVQKPQCVICHVVLSNDALRPSRLERHITTAHPMLKGKPRVFFC